MKSSKEVCTVWPPSVCTLRAASHQPTAPVITLEERSRRDGWVGVRGGGGGGNGASEGLQLYIFTLRFIGRPAKTSSWLESEQQRETVKEMQEMEVCSLEAGPIEASETVYFQCRPSLTAGRLLQEHMDYTACGYF